MMKRIVILGVCASVAAGAALAITAAITAARTPARDIDEWRVRALSTRDWTSMTRLRAASWAGNDDAARALGTVLIGDADAGRVREGIGWLERSARSGDTDAQLALGRVLFEGASGTKPDYAASRKWLERAAAHLSNDADGDAHAPSPGAEAAYRLASIHRNGYGVPRDADAGFVWLRLAALGGEPQAQFQLANVYRARGDDGEALTWLRRAAHAENPEANLALAMAYRNGELGLHRDEGEYWTYVKETLHDYKHRVQ